MENAVNFAPKTVNVLQESLADDFTAWRIDYEHNEKRLCDIHASKSAMARGYAIGYDEGYEEKPLRGNVTGRQS